MRFLADESIEQRLRGPGHDVVAVSELELWRTLAGRTRALTLGGGSA